jgi:signal transduction histidine kinase
VSWDRWHGRPPGPPGPWWGRWGFWNRLDPELREKIVREMRQAYAQGFGHRHRHRHRHPWDRVIAEAIGRHPGWHQRVRWELRLHYGAHLHRRLFLWFGVAIFLSLATTLVAAHVGRAWLAAHPGRAVFLFGIPALVLWSGAGRIARRVSRPLYELTRVAQAIGEGNFAARASLESIECSGFDEMAVLAQAFNDMAGRLAGQLTEQRELLAAVSHELRTPLSRIRLLVEIARQGTVDAHTLDEIEREAIEIDTLVGELLASARLEFQALAQKPLEAGELARRALERAGEDAAKLSVGPPKIPFSGDPTLVARALANLIDNARKHGGGLDRMNVRRIGAEVVFEVLDRGPGFAAGEETRVFERFYRGENGGTHGSLGLGLALVRRIAEAHGGRARAANRSGGGAVLTLELAVDPPTPSASPPPPAP